MRVTLLGTIGWMPSDRRETTCFACRAGDSLFIFDAGTGLRRLREPAQAALLDGARDVHLFLTQYHLDHVCGLEYLPGVLPGRGLVIHAPAAELNGVEPERAVAGLLRRPYNPRDWEELTNLRLEPVVAGPNEIAGHTVRVRAQQHSDVSVAYRVDDASCWPPTPGSTPGRWSSPRVSAFCCTRPGTTPPTRAPTRRRRSCWPATPPTAKPAPSPAWPPTRESAASCRCTSTRCTTRPITPPSRPPPAPSSRARTCCQTARSSTRTATFDTLGPGRRQASGGPGLIPFRSKRFLVVALVIAALVVFLLPAFVAFR